jgi:hypothetical protein
MTIATQAIAASNYPSKFSVANVTEAATAHTIIGISPDAATVYASNGGALEVSTDSGATFTTAHTFTATVSGIVTFADGEAGVATKQGGAGYQIWRSTGWATNKATATWTVVLDGSTHLNAEVASAFSWRQANVGTNGVVVVNEYGAQTIGGGDSRDANAARRAYISTNHGATWTQIFDIYTDGNVQQPANCHLHSIAYDEPNDRVLLTFGDSTGDGNAVAGSGNMQFAYSDLRGAAGSWHFFPASQLGVDYQGNFNQGSASPQFVTIHVTPDSIVLMPDGRPYGVFVFPKTGYRTYGSPYLVAMLNAGAPSNLIGQRVTQNFGSTSVSPKPMFYGYNESDGAVARLVMSHDNGLNNYEVWRSARVFSGGTGISVFGPTTTGKLVGNSGYSTLKLWRADLVSPA